MASTGWSATKAVGTMAAGAVGATTGAVVGAACKVPGVERVGERTKIKIFFLNLELNSYFYKKLLFVNMNFSRWRCWGCYRHGWRRRCGCGRKCRRRCWWRCCFRHGQGRLNRGVSRGFSQGSLIKSIIISSYKFYFI